MRIAIAGGGPGGLYLSILLKRLDPAHEVVVYERNAPDDTFGFGVVFSDETLAAFEAADPESYAEITRRFVRWSEIDVHYRGEVITSGGHGFSALGRKNLLNILQTRAADLGVDLRFRTEAPELEGDLIVAADGVNSTLRARYADTFRPIAGPPQGDLRVVRHRARLRRLHVPDRGDRRRRRPGPRLSLQRHDEHVHRRDDRGDRPRQGRPARRCSATA